MIPHRISLLQLRHNVTMEKKKLNSKEKMELEIAKQNTDFCLNIIFITMSILSGCLVILPVLISLLAFQMYRLYKVQLYPSTKRKLIIRVWFPLKGKLQKFRLKMKELDVIKEEV